MKKKIIAGLCLTLAVSNVFAMTTCAAEKKTVLTEASSYEAGNASSDYVVSATGYDSETNTSTGDYILPESAKYSLTEKQLTGLTDIELFLARNEIFARYGRMFKDATLDQFFRTKSWYHPTIPADEFDAEMLNATDAKNVQTILNYEQRRNSQYIPGGTSSANTMGCFSKQDADVLIDTINRTLGRSLTFDTSVSDYNYSVDNNVTRIYYEEVNGKAKVKVAIGLDGTVYQAVFEDMGFEAENEAASLFCQGAGIAGFDKDSFAALEKAHDKFFYTTSGLYDFSFDKENRVAVSYINYK